MYMKCMSTVTHTDVDENDMFLWKKKGKNFFNKLWSLNPHTPYSLTLMALGFFSFILYGSCIEPRAFLRTAIGEWSIRGQISSNTCMLNKRISWGLQMTFISGSEWDFGLQKIPLLVDWCSFAGSNWFSCTLM